MLNIKEVLVKMDIEELKNEALKQVFKQTHKRILELISTKPYTLTGLALDLSISTPLLAYYMNGNQKWSYGLVTIRALEWYSDSKHRRPYLLRVTDLGLELLEELRK